MGISTEVENSIVIDEQEVLVLALQSGDTSEWVYPQSPHEQVEVKLTGESQDNGSVVLRGGVFRIDNGELVVQSAERVVVKKPQDEDAVAALRVTGEIKEIELEGNSRIRLEPRDEEGRIIDNPTLWEYFGKLTFSGQENRINGIPLREGIDSLEAMQVAEKNRGKRERRVDGDGYISPLTIMFELAEDARNSLPTGSKDPASMHPRNVMRLLENKMRREEETTNQITGERPTAVTVFVRKKVPALVK